MNVFDALPVSFGSSKTEKDPNSYKNRNRDNVWQVVENGFSKCFEFSNKRPSTFPSQDGLFTHGKWEVETLQKLKEELNGVKSKLNSYNLADWHDHTRKNNYAGTVMRSLRKFQPEFLTQAWCKFYEVVSRYKLIPKQCLKKKLLNSVHLCEAPGAFIASLNHFLKLNHPEIEWKWFATTLNPYYEGNDLQHMVNDDRFIINTLENWWFGNDETGNVYGDNYLSSLIEKTKFLHPVYLVTADGSIDCLSDPAEQEKKVVHLHFTETVCALNILERGGSFLLKTFTMFECDTVCLMYLLRCCFTHINVFKPVTSKEGNSEVYVVCLGYKGKDHVPVLEKLNVYYYKEMKEALFSRNDIPDFFIQEIINCATKFKLIQTSVIERNIETYKHQHKRKRSRLQLMDIRDSTANLFIEKYKIRPISPKDFVVHDQDADAICLNLFPRDESGTFLERKMFKQLDTKAMLDFYKGKLDLVETDWDVEDIFWFTFSPNSKIKLNLKFGKPIEKVRTSKFCKGNLLAIYTELVKLCLETGVKIDIPDQLDLDKFICKNAIDTNDFSWTENYNECQKCFFEKFMSACEKLEVGDDLILKGFPLLTQFNVGVIFILGHLFEKVGFVNPSVSPYSIILKGLKDSDLKSLISSISSSMCDRKTDGLVSLVHITYLCESEILRCVTWINQITLKFLSLIMLKKLKETRQT
ncbi:cap-specific mRNA (nucleoside-2'-O-)-methyltransferase 2 isoform X2 [Cimex lectularius]|uniref:Cap-specific mRNA (nucleoside-2'-O-)-methyltransferase 2 n=1 Tax=Cimex lectularius TaxID=79782 RepID=A0A8I6RG43_CIMLE|nr:cap-specific mRNA (nucleoside-2'-O-)-methyltransferase 2 isoform X2 [Cimex lectularius]